MIICDLCGETKNCLQKEIEGKEYDICSECWTPLAERLKGKGRPKDRETVFLPPPRQIKEREIEEPEPLPGEPPKIWGEGHRAHASCLHAVLTDIAAIFLGVVAAMSRGLVKPGESLSVVLRLAKVA